MSSYIGHRCIFRWSDLLNISLLWSYFFFLIGWSFNCDWAIGWSLRSPLFHPSTLHGPEVHGCLSLSLCLQMVLSVAKVATTSFSVVPGERLFVWGEISMLSLGSNISSYFFFSSLSSSFSCSSFSSLFSSSSFPSYVSTFYVDFSFFSTSSSSSVFSVSSSSYLTSLCPRLEVGVYLGVINCVLMNDSLSMSTKVDQGTRMLILLRASPNMSLIGPWWARCWYFLSLTLWLISLIECRRKCGMFSICYKGVSPFNLRSCNNVKWYP